MSVLTAARPCAESFTRSEDAYHAATSLLRTYLVRPAEQRVCFLAEQCPVLPYAALEQMELLLLGVDHARYQVALVLARYQPEGTS